MKLDAIAEGEHAYFHVDKVVDVELCQAPGAAYVFARDTIGSWLQTAKFTALDGTQNDRFGHSVALSDEALVVGAPQDDLTTGLDEAFAGRDVGAAYAFALKEALP